jgi:glycosyltransferase involved in cell wall biosynthesis
MNAESRQTIVIAVTVTETIETILRSYILAISEHYFVHLIYGKGSVELKIDSPNIYLHQSTIRRSFSIASDLIAIIHATILLRRIRPTLVHSFTPKAGLVFQLAAQLAGVRRRVHTFTGLLWENNRKMSGRILVVVDRIIAKCVTDIVAESKGVEAGLLRIGVRCPHPTVIGSGSATGIDLAYYRNDLPNLQIQADENRSVLGISEKEFVFGYIGRLTREKGIVELIEAFEMMPESTRLVLVGAMDERAPLSSEEIQKLKSNIRIKWVGFKDDIRPYIHMCNTIVLPSYREGMPNVILQACAMSKPVIVTDVSGSREIVANNISGWVVQHRNPHALSSAMFNAVGAEPGVLEQMGKNGKALVAQHYDQTSQLKRMIEFYRNVSADGTQGENYADVN